MPEKFNEQIIKHSPFPPLEQGSGSLYGKDIFTSWQKFQTGDEGSLENVPVCVHSENSAELPTEAQTNAYRYLKENELLVTQKVIAGLFLDYPQIRAAYEGIEPEFLPEIAQPADFQSLIRLINVHVNYESEGELAYIGFEFDCLWDMEHGLGVLTCRDRYLGCNDAEAAWNPDLAQS